MNAMAVSLAEVDEEAHELLHDMCQAAYLDGQCYEFAIALHEGLGWPIVGLMDGDTIRHAVLQPPGTNFFDARGRISAEQVGVPFGLGKNPVLKLVTPNDLRHQRPVHEYSIERARSMAEMLWPGLQWSKPLTERLVAFTCELAEVCRRHGLQLRSLTETAGPLVVPLSADELPVYRLAPTVDGTAYMLLPMR